MTDDSTASSEEHIEAPVTPTSSESCIEDGAASVEFVEVVTHLSTTATDTSVTLQIEPADEKAAAAKKRKKISKELIIFYSFSVYSFYNSFLQRNSIACSAERCISYRILSA